MKKPIIIDTAASSSAFLALAYAAKRFDVRAVLVSCEAEVQQVAAMAQTLEINCPVYAGARKPIIRPQGAPRLGRRGEHDYAGMLFLNCAATTADGYAWDALKNEADACGGRLELLTLGSLTNIAIAFAKYESLHQNIARITVFGGARFCGHCYDAPLSEYNFFFDPEAAYMTLHSGAPITIADLNACGAARFTLPQVEKMLKAVSGGEILAKYLSLKKTDELRFPELCAAALCESTKECVVSALQAEVETDSDLTRGKLVIEYDTAGKGVEPNADVMMEIDENALAQRIIDAFCE